MKIVCRGGEQEVPYGKSPEEIAAYWAKYGPDAATAEKFYSEDQPRDERGRWTDDGGGAGGMKQVSILPAEPGTGTKSEKPLRKRGILPKGKTRIGLVEEAPAKTGAMAVSAEAQAKIDAFEKAHVDDQTEHALIVDAATGKVLLEKGGNERMISFSKEEVESLVGRDIVLTHSHPGGWAFSADDLQFASHVGALEMRAVGRNDDGGRFRFTATRGPGGWADEVRIALAFQTEQMLFQPVLYRMEKQGKSSHEINQLFWHNCWTDNAPKLGFTYHRWRMSA